jgi:hypothetical protein
MMYSQSLPGRCGRDKDQMIQHSPRSLPNPQAIHYGTGGPPGQAISQECRSLSALFGDSSFSGEESYRPNVAQVIRQNFTDLIIGSVAPGEQNLIRGRSRAAELPYRLLGSF